MPRCSTFSLWLLPALIYFVSSSSTNHHRLLLLLLIVCIAFVCTLDGGRSNFPLSWTPLDNTTTTTITITGGVAQDDRLTWHGMEWNARNVSPEYHSNRAIQKKTISSTWLGPERQSLIVVVLLLLLLLFLMRRRRRMIEMVKWLIQAHTRTRSPLVATSRIQYNVPHSPTDWLWLE